MRDGTCSSGRRGLGRNLGPRASIASRLLRLGRPPRRCRTPPPTSNWPAPRRRATARGRGFRPRDRPRNPTRVRPLRARDRRLEDRLGLRKPIAREVCGGAASREPRRKQPRGGSSFRTRREKPQRAASYLIERAIPNPNGECHFQRSGKRFSDGTRRVFARRVRQISYGTQSVTNERLAFFPAGARPSGGRHRGDRAAVCFPPPRRCHGLYPLEAARSRRRRAPPAKSRRSKSTTMPATMMHASTASLSRASRARRCALAPAPRVSPLLAKLTVRFNVQPGRPVARVPRASPSSRGSP